MKQSKLRIPTLLLAVWMLIAAIPITAFAELLQLQTEPMPTDSTVYVLAEDNSKRTAFEKHYYCSDGTFVAVTYPEAVHYQDEQGEWVDVDLRMTNDSAAQAYRSQSGSFKTSFSKPGGRSDASMMSTGNMSAVLPAVSMESGEYALSWTLAGEQPAGAVAGTYAANASSSSSCVLSASEQATAQVMGELKTAAPAMAVQKLPVTDPDAFALPSVANQVIYEDIFGEDQNVSVRYSVSLNKIEEDILITAPTEMTSFSMQIECAGLTPVLNDDNSVDFLDNDGNMVYHISVPYLADAAFAVSYEVGVTLTEQNGTCTVTYTPDAEWMNDPARVYPIMLDPAVTTREYEYAISDTYVESNTQTCHLNEQYLRISQDDGVQRVALLRFNQMPRIDESMPIISASLNTCSLMSLNHSVVIDVKLEALASDLNMLMVRFDDLSEIEKTEIDRVSLSATTAVTTFDITSCIGALYSGQSSGCFAISLVGNGYALNIPPIYSTEQSVVALRPYVSVTYGYTLPENLAVNDSIQVQNLGSGGYLYPNSGLPGAGNYIMHAPSSAALALRTFVLRGNTANGTYKLEMTPYSDTSNVFVSANVSSKLVLLKNASEVSETVKQDWLVVPYSANSFKIVLASDMRYVLTAVGTASTYAATPSITTAGCVSITQCNGTPTDAQLWKIYKNSELVINSTLTNVVEDGVYYLNNYGNGCFVNNSSAKGITGSVSSIHRFIEWDFKNIGNGKFTIRNANDTTKYLGVDTNDNNKVKMFTNSSGYVPENCQWRLVLLASGEYTIINVSNNQCLYCESADPTVAMTTVSRGLLKFIKWRIIDPDEYNEIDNVVFDSILMLAGETAQMSIIVNDLVYPDYIEIDNDFTYESLDEDVAIVNASTGVIEGVGKGATQIIATHRLTNREFTVEVSVRHKAIIILPGVMGSQLYAAEDFVIESNTLLGIPSTTTIAKDTRLWDPNIQTPKAKVYALALNNAGESVYPVRTNAPTINQYNKDTDEFQYGSIDMYRQLYNELYEEYRGQGYDIVLYEYDWRYDPYQTALALSDFVEENYYGDVIFVSHSMGGIVSSYYLSLGVSQRALVDKHISVGTPYLGSPELPYIYVTGYALGWVENQILKDAVKEIVRNMPAMYALFPYEQHWSPYFSYRAGTDYTLQCSTFEQTKSVLSQYMPGWNNTISNSAINNRNDLFLDNGEHITTCVDSYYIVGTNLETTYKTHAIFDNLMDPTVFTGVTCDKNLNGDGTVTLHSATIGDTLDEDRVIRIVGGDHTGMISGGTSMDNSAIDIILELISE